MGTEPHREAAVLAMSDYYERNAKDFYASTVAVDMSEFRARFLELIPPGGRVLDAGCGSGRDSAAFLDAGLDVSAFDASPSLAKLASELTGLDVRVCGFSDIHDLEAFDGVWACASLLHVSRGELPEVLGRLVRSLRSGGAFYASFKQGEGSRESGGREFTDLTLERLKSLVVAAGLVMHRAWRTEDVRPGREGEYWVNALARKSAARLPGKGAAK